MFSATNQVKQLKISGFRVFALWVGYFGQKKHFFLFLILIGPNHSEMVPNGKKLSDTTFGPFGTISEWFGPIWTKNGKNGFFTKSGQPTEQKSYFDWFRPFLSTPANPVQFFWLKMACTYVPDIDLYVSCWTRTSRGSLRPPKRPSKARNGQKDRFFWSRPKIVGQPDIFNCFTCFMAENINVPSRHTQKWHWNGLNIKKCHETTKITFDSYCETPCIYMGYRYIINTHFKSCAQLATKGATVFFKWL